MTQGAAAYTRLQRPDNSISQGLQYWGGIQARKNAADDARDERDQVRKTAENKEMLEEHKKNLELFNYQNSGFSSVDDMMYDVADQAMKSYSKVHREYTAAKQSGNLDQAMALQGKLKRKERSFEKVKEMQDKYRETYEGYMKTADSGNISGVEGENFEKQIQALAVDYNGRVMFDENDDPYLLIKTDDNKVEKVTYQEMMTGKWRPYMTQDLNALTTGISEKLGEKVFDRATGKYIKTEQSFDSVRDTAEQYIDAALGNPEMLADAYYQLVDNSSNIKKKDNFKPEQIQEVKNILMGRLEAMYNEKLSLKADSTRNDNKETPKTRTPEQEKASRLHYDVLRATEEGDYTVLMTNIKDKFGDGFTAVKDVVRNGNQLILRDESGKKIGSVNNNRRAIIDYLTNNSDAYRNMKADNVLSEDPVEYRDSKVDSKSILDIADRLFDSSGEPLEDDEEIMKILKAAGLKDMEDPTTFFPPGNSLKYKNVEISTASKAQFKRDLAKALELKQSNSTATTTNQSAPPPIPSAKN